MPTPKIAIAATKALKKGKRAIMKTIKDAKYRKKTIRRASVVGATYGVGRAGRKNKE